MISKYKYKSLIWIDLENPKEDEITYIKEEFDIPEELGQKMTNSGNSRVFDIHKDLMYLELPFPKLNERYNLTQNNIAFLIGKDFLVTIHENNMEAVQKIMKVFEDEVVQDKHMNTNHTLLVFSQLMNALHENSHTTIRRLDRRLQNHRKINKTQIYLLSTLLVIAISVILSILWL